MLADFAMLAAAETLAAPGVAIAGLDLKTNFLRPVAPDGSDLIARAEVIHSGQDDRDHPSGGHEHRGKAGTTGHGLLDVPARPASEPRRARAGNRGGLRVSSAPRRGRGPSGGAVSPARSRGAPCRRASKSSTVRLPRATSSIVPTSTRTMWRMNVSASIQSSSRWPGKGPASCWDRHSALTMSRSKRTCSVSVGVKAVKSWLPTSGRRAALELPAIKRVGPPQRSPLLERVPHRRGQQPVAVGSGAGVAAGVEPLGRTLASTTAISGGSTAFSRCANSFGGSRRGSKLATCPQAWTPASVRPATVSDARSPRIASKAASSSPWIGAQTGLRGPAGERRAVVGDRQPQGAHGLRLLARRAARPARGRPSRSSPSGAGRA